MKKITTYYWLLIVIAFAGSINAQTTFDCPYCDLSGQDFSGKNLQNVNFMGAKLDNVNLQGADLTGAYLSQASLQNANLQQAKLGTTAKGATNFSLSNLTNANFSGAVIGATIFYHATINNTNFSNTNLSQAKFGQIPVLSPQNSINTIMPKPHANAGVDVPAGNSVYVDGNLGVDNSTCGAVGNPCKTINQGINNCPWTTCNVLVAYGQYTTPAGYSVNLRTGVNIFGGYYNGQPTDFQSVITLNANSTNGTHATIWGSDISTPITIANFIVNALPTTANDAPSMVMQLINCANVQLYNVNINASKGGTGSKGADATKANDGGNGGNGTTVFGGAGGNSPHPNNNAGGMGGNQTAGKTSCDHCGKGQIDYSYTGSTTYMSGGAGLPANTNRYASGSSFAGHSSKFCTGWIDGTPGQNASGSGGYNGFCGGTNSSSTNTTGHFVNGAWVSAASPIGESGTYGGGGGGGGAGSAVAYCNCVCGDADQHYGTGGGGGGAGGEGATGGAGGMQGGASIGILLLGSTCTLNSDVKIVGGAGGDGGNGGNGAAGGNGGVGGDGGPTNNIGDKGGTGGKGGRGGNGGIGGASGGGAGGNGGPSYCIVEVTDTQGHASFALGGPQYYSGVSGNVGTGGNGGSISGCTGGKGANGVRGDVRSVWQATNQ